MGAAAATQVGSVGMVAELEVKDGGHVGAGTRGRSMGQHSGDPSPRARRLPLDAVHTPPPPPRTSTPTSATTIAVVCSPTPQVDGCLIGSGSGCRRKKLRRETQRYGTNLSEGAVRLSGGSRKIQ